jgi:thioredoxin-like negative regulator of GroEL
MEALEVNAFPTLVAVRNGRVIDKCVGIPSAERMQNLVFSLLTDGVTAAADGTQQEENRRLSSKLVYFAGTR